MSGRRPSPAAFEVRAVGPADRDAWFRMRDALWPGSPGDHRSEIADFLASPPDDQACFLAVADGEPVGFVEVGLRKWADGCDTSPVGYLEGIWVDPEGRRAGVGRALVEAAEAWARGRGCREMGSDRAIDNEASGAFHESVGYEEVVRAVLMRKSL